MIRLFKALKTHFKGEIDEREQFKKKIRKDKNSNSKNNGSSKLSRSEY